MKTEKEFSEYFIAHCPHRIEDQEYVNQLSKCYWSDLTSHLQEYFEFAERLLITEKAAQLLAQRLPNCPQETAWSSVIRDFYENKSWGYRTVTKKPNSKKSEEQKIFWKLFKYIWAFFQSMIILKTAVYYFGLESTQHPDQVSGLWVWFFFSLSLSSLVYFAYRNYGDRSDGD